MHVEIWSDIACPWCYVGKRRFEAALAAYEHADEVTVTWRSFELDPHAPREREHDATTHLSEKYGTTREEALAMHARMTETAAEEGLEFRFDIARGGNTFDAHRLLHLAAAHGAQDAMKERLLRGYLGEGEPIGDPAALERLAVEIGLPADEVRDVLDERPLWRRGARRGAHGRAARHPRGAVLRRRPRDRRVGRAPARPARRAAAPGARRRPAAAGGVERRHVRDRRQRLLTRRPAP